MIDMHNHLLFGVDDGCQTIEESIMMIKAAINAGVTVLILTPHYGPKRHYMADKNLINNNFALLVDEVKKQNLPIKLHLGREIDEIDNIITLLKDNKIETMNGTNYVLIDFGMAEADIDEYCYNLIVNGYKPIIAHAERYQYIESFDLFHKWRKTGALIQVNASNLLNPSSKQVKKRVQFLLKNNLIDCIGSDAHRNPKSYQDFKKAYDFITKKHKQITLKHDLLLKG